MDFNVMNNPTLTRTPQKEEFEREMSNRVHIICFLILVNGRKFSNRHYFFFIIIPLILLRKIINISQSQHPPVKTSLSLK